MKVLFVCRRHPQQTVSPFVAGLRDALRGRGLTVDVHTIASGGAGYLSEVPAIRRTVVSGAYDLVHAHYGLSGVSAWLGRAGRPMVLSLLGSDLMRGAQPGASAGDRLVTRLSRQMARVADGVVVMSREMADVLGQPAEIIPTGIDFTRFTQIPQDAARRELGLGEEERIVLFVGDPARPVKNHALAEAAVQSLEDPTVRLLTVHAEPHERVNLFFNAADVHLLTSHREGSPNVVKEAMACGIPIVATDVGDVKERIGQTEGCVVVEPTVQSVRDGLISALRFGGRTAGRADVESLSSRGLADRMTAVYDRALSTSSEEPA